MTSDDSKPTRGNWTARLESLTGTQMKALLVVASESRQSSTEALKKGADTDQALLDDMTRDRAGSNAGLLEKASNGSTGVAELTRIKDLAKDLIKESDDSRRREAARLLYHVAVAAAVVHHAESISGRSTQKQQLLFEKLAAAWAGHTIGQLFADAAARTAGSRSSSSES
jgi:hypothetical protein